MNTHAQKLFALPIALCALVAVLFASAFMPTAALAETTFNLDDWGYELRPVDSTVLLFRYDGEETDYTIPATVDLDGVQFKVGLSRDNYIRKSQGQYLVLGAIQKLSFEEGVFVDDYECLFANNKNLVRVDLEGLTATNPTSTKGMFGGCENLERVNIASILTQDITDTSFMFDCCYKLWRIYFDDVDTSQVTDMCGMFYFCESMSFNDLIEEFNTSNVTDMSQMFEQCHSLRTLYLNSFDTSSVTKMDGIFSGCVSLVFMQFTGETAYMSLDGEPQFKVPAGAKLGIPSTPTHLDNLYSWYTGSWVQVQESGETSEALTASELEAKALAEEGLSGTWHAQDVISDWDYWALEDEKGNKWVYLTEYTGQETTYTIPASYTSNGETYRVVIFGDNDVEHGHSINFGTIENLSFENGVYASSGKGLFLKAEGLKDVKLAGLRLVGNDYPEYAEYSTSLEHMFDSCTALTSVDFTGFDTSKVTSMEGMFANCNALTRVDLSYLDTSSVTTMEDMFLRCFSLESLDLSSFDTSKVEDMSYFLSGCENLTSLALGENFVIGESTATDEMLPMPTKTASSAKSTGKWGLGSEEATTSYLPDELIAYAQGGASLKGTWYAQAVAAAPDDTDDGDDSDKDDTGSDTDDGNAGKDDTGSDTDKGDTTKTDGTDSNKDSSSAKKSDSNNSSVSPKKSVEIPQTGDSTNLTVVAGLSLAGLACIGAARVLKKY